MDCGYSTSKSQDSSSKTSASDSQDADLVGRMHNHVLFMSNGLRSEDTKGSVKGYDWNSGLDFESCLNSFANTGFQATNFSASVQEIRKMIELRESIAPESDPDAYCKNNCTIFLGYTSNMVSCGVRESIRFLVEHNYVDCIVTTAGGVEEDLIKCFMPTLLGSFDLDGGLLRDKGLNRIGNLLVPNENYCKFEDWITPIFDEMYKDFKEKQVIWTPSKMISKFGEKINNHESIYYWAWKNKIPVFCPALTDGSIGDMLFFYAFNKTDFVLDILADLRHLNMMAIKARQTGVIILGGGLVKHHICNANLMRNGADYAVFINTGTDYDGSDSGAKPDEAKSWGKLKKESRPVKIHAEASLVFPLLVGQTFAKTYHSSQR